MHLLKHQDTLGFRGDYRIVSVNFWPEIRAAVEHLRRQELRQVAVVDPEEARRILVEVCPCWQMEHRMGVCPLGLDHRTKDSEGDNTVLTSLKKSVIDQMVGNASPLDLKVKYIATGTSSAATDVTATQLGVETYRDTPTYLDDTSSTQLQAFWYFGPDRANAGSDLQEWGIVAGPATATLGSGIVVARFLQRFVKNMGTAASGQWTFNES